MPPKFGIHGALPAIGNIKFLPGNYFTGKSEKKIRSGKPKKYLVNFSKFSCMYKPWDIKLYNCGRSLKCQTKTSPN